MMKYASIWLAVSVAVAQAPPPAGITKATFANVLKLNAYADNWCMIYINGKLAAVDQIEFLPHNVVAANILPIYPMTIAVLAKDNADPKTGLEYTTQIGDAGFILKLSDGTVTNSTWKVKTFFKGPLNRDTANPKVMYTPIPANWFGVDFNDSGWANATEYTQARVGPDGDFATADFTNAKFIWSDDLDLDNTVIFRTTVQAPANYRKTWNADGDFNISDLASEAKLSTLTSPHLFQVNADGLAVGYVTRTRDGQETIEQIVDGIDLGLATDQIVLVLYASNVPVDVAAISASLNGSTTEVAVEPLAPVGGMWQFRIAIPRTLANAGAVEVVITANGKVSNAVTVSIK